VSFQLLLAAVSRKLVEAGDIYNPENERALVKATTMTAMSK
jgi:hypothetical protein